MTAFRSFSLIVVLCFILPACRRRSVEPKPPEAPVTVAAKAAPVSPLMTLTEKVKRDGKPPAITAADILTVYDDNRLAGDRNYKGESIWLVGAVKKIDSSFGRTFVVMWDNLARPIAIHVLFAKEDVPMIATLRKDDVIAVWGRVQGMSSGNVVVQNSILLTKERQERLKSESGK